MAKLHEEVKKGRVSVVAKLMDTVEVDLVDADGNTALLFAAGLGHTEIARLLLDRGADPNRANANDFTPLMSAARNSRHACVALLLERGADLRAESDAGVAPLMLAANYADVETVQMLLAKGANPNQRGSTGFNAVICAVHNDQYGPEVLQALIEAGADLSSRDKDGRTPLERARARGFHRVADFLQKWLAT